MVLSEKGGAYQEFATALNMQLAGGNVAVTLLVPEMPLPEADLVVTAGMRASAGVAQTPALPQLAVLVPKEGYAKLQQGRSNAGLSAIYLDQPYRRQLDLISALLPASRRIGLLYAGEPFEIAALRALAQSRKIELYERKVTSPGNLFITLQELLISSDVLLALPDGEIYNSSSIRNILLATYRSRVPLIGFSAGYVKAGALGAIYSTPEQIAQQTAAIIRQYAETRVLPPAQFAKEFEVLVNEQVARSLGLTLKSTAQLRAEIGITQ